MVIDEELTQRKKANPALDNKQLPQDYEEEDEQDLLALKNHTNAAGSSSSGIVERLKLQPSGEIFNIFPKFTSKEHLESKVELIEVVEASL